MMFGQCLLELEPGELVSCGNPTNNSSMLQVNEVPIGRASGHAGELPADIGDVHRVLRSGQDVDNGPPPVGIAKVSALELNLDQLV